MKKRNLSSGEGDDDRQERECEAELADEGAMGPKKKGGKKGKKKAKEEEPPPEEPSGAHHSTESSLDIEMLISTPVMQTQSTTRWTSRCSRR